MGSEREYLGGVALAIALTIVPMTWWVYWSLSLALAALVVRIIWISLRPVWARYAASLVAVTALALVLAPNLLKVSPSL